MDRIPLNENNTVLVRAAGDVCIRGWDQADMQALCDHGRLVYTQQENGVVYVVSKSDLCLSLPAGVPVRVEHISGDAYIGGLSGRLEVQKVGGDLAVEACAQMDLAVTGGNLLLREMKGPVTIQKVGGDLTGEALDGGLSVEQVGGSASFQAGVGALRVRAGGDLKLLLPGQGSEEVTLKAGGDIEVYVEPTVSARLELTCGGRDIDIEVGDRSAHIEDDSYTGVLGGGERLVRARAGGDIRVTDEVWDEDDLADEFDDLAEEWESWRGDLEGELEEGNVGLSGIEERVRRRAEESARRAEERVRSAMERVERQNRRRQDIFSRFGIRWGNFWPNVPEGKDIKIPEVNVKIPPIHIPEIDVRVPEINFPGMGSMPPQAVSQPPQPPAPDSPDPVRGTANGVTNEERMQVLKMLREHKITVEEAEELLRALGSDGA